LYCIVNPVLNGQYKLLSFLKQITFKTKAFTLQITQRLLFIEQLVFSFFLEFITQHYLLSLKIAIHFIQVGLLVVNFFLPASSDIIKFLLRIFIFRQLVQDIFGINNGVFLCINSKCCKPHATNYKQYFFHIEMF
jgi:hypothetical protein